MGTTRALLEAGVGAGDDAGAEDEGRRDSGYYSRRDSKVSVLSAGRKGSGQNFAEEEDDQDKDDHHDKGEKTTPKHREGGDRGVRPLTMVYEDTEDSGEDGDGEDDEEDEKRR